MKKGFLLLLISLLYISVSYAQLSKLDSVKIALEVDNKDTVAWTHRGSCNIGFNEGAMHNWTSGGEIASLTINGIFSGNITRLHHKTVWSNSLDMAYGLYYAYSSDFIPRKLDDRIDFTSKFGAQLRLDSTKNVYITSLFNFKSQLTKGYDYTVPSWDSTTTSKFLSPAYLTLGEGIEYRKGSNVSFFLSPIAGRATVVSRYYTARDTQGAFGVPYNKTINYQLGAYFSSRYVINFTKKIVFKTRLDLYSNYLAKDSRDSTGAIIKKDSPGNISLLCDNLFCWKMSKCFNVTIAAAFIYDNNIPYSKTYVDETGTVVNKNLPGDNIGWLQVKQVFSLGFEYKI